MPLAGVFGLNPANRTAYIIGYGDDTVRPLDYITRAEIIAAINRMLDRIPGADLMATAKKWLDNAEDAWYYKNIQEAAAGCADAQ